MLFSAYYWKISNKDIIYLAFIQFYNKVLAHFLSVFKISATLICSIQKGNFSVGRHGPRTLGKRYWKKLNRGQYDKPPLWQKMIPQRSKLLSFVTLSQLQLCLIFKTCAQCYSLLFMGLHFRGRLLSLTTIIRLVRNRFTMTNPLAYYTVV